MFGAVICDEDNCKEFLEMVLQIPIERVEVSKEKSIVYHPEYKGVRLDVYAKDEHNTHYNVEMQAIRKKALGKRARYYQPNQSFPGRVPKIKVQRNSIIHKWKQKDFQFCYFHFVKLHVR